MKSVASSLGWPVGASVQTLTEWFNSSEAAAAAKEADVPARAPSSLRVCTYNVHFWLGSSQTKFESNVEEILQVIRRTEADVLVLNEFVPIRDEKMTPMLEERLASMGYVHSTLASSPKWHEVRNLVCIKCRRRMKTKNF
jgi:hypothetical protein